MKTMIPLRKLVEDVENETLDADTTLIDADGIAILEEDYDTSPERPDLESQED